MAKAPKSALALIDQTTTAAGVSCTNLRFEDVTQNPHPDFFTMDMTVKFNGFAGEIAPTVTFARNATPTQKQNAVRAVVNLELGQIEPAAGALNAANIQITGLPV